MQQHDSGKIDGLPDDRSTGVWKIDGGKVGDDVETAVVVFFL